MSKKQRLRSAGLRSGMLLLMFSGWIAMLSAQGGRSYEYPFDTRLGAGLSAGLGALPGVDVAMHPLPYLYFRLGYHHFDLRLKEIEFDPAAYGFGQQKLLIDSKIHLNQIFFSIEWAPTRDRNWRAVIGGALGLENFIEARVSLKDSLQVNDLTLSPEEVGYIEGTYTTDQPLYPYLGLGYGRTVPKKHWGFTVDLGIMHRGAPLFAIESTNLFENNEENAAALEENFHNWQWQPVLNIRLAYRVY